MPAPLMDPPMHPTSRHLFAPKMLGTVRPPLPGVAGNLRIYQLNRMPPIFQSRIGHLETTAQGAHMIKVLDTGACRAKGPDTGGTQATNPISARTRTDRRPPDYSVPVFKSAPGGHDPRSGPRAHFLTVGWSLILGSAQLATLDLPGGYGGVGEGALRLRIRRRLETTAVTSAQTNDSA